MKEIEKILKYKAWICTFMLVTFYKYISLLIKLNSFIISYDMQTPNMESTDVVYKQLDEGVNHFDQIK